MEVPQAHQVPPELAVSDLRVPGRDGFVTIARLPDGIRQVITVDTLDKQKTVRWPGHHERLKQDIMKIYTN